MKKIRLIILLSFIFLTGCTATYDIEISNSTIKEKLTVNNDTNNDAKSFSSTYAIPKEDKKYNYQDNGTSSTFSYNFNFDNYIDSYMVNSCYDGFHFYKEKDYYVLQTDSEFRCYPLQIGDHGYINYDNLKINIKLDGYDVIENNAEEITDNTYSWNLNKNNYKKSILIKFKKNKQEINPNQNDNGDSKKKSSFNIIYVIIIGVGIILIAAIAIIYGMVLNQKQNKL